MHRVATDEQGVKGEGHPEPLIFDAPRGQTVN